MDEGKLTKILQSRDKIITAKLKNKKLHEQPYKDGGYMVGEQEWTIYDSSLENIGHTFITTLPKTWVERQNLRNYELFQAYVEQILSKSRHDLYAIELGGSGSYLFRGFTKDFFKKTIGVCLSDIRLRGLKINDTNRNHYIIEGDILNVDDTKLYEEIQDQLGNNKTDLIISRMMGPLVYINKNNAVLDRIIRNWYNILNENGLMFVQFEWDATLANGHPLPGEKQTEVEGWAKKIKAKFPEVDIQVGDNVLRLHKRKGSPDTLPPATQLF